MHTVDRIKCFSSNAGCSVVRTLLVAVLTKINLFSSYRENESAPFVHERFTFISSYLLRLKKKSYVRDKRSIFIFTVHEDDKF